MSAIKLRKLKRYKENFPSVIGRRRTKIYALKKKVENNLVFILETLILSTTYMTP